MDHQSTAAYIRQNQERKPKRNVSNPSKKDDETNDNGGERIVSIAQDAPR
jgi:hypothetical protein